MPDSALPRYLRTSDLAKAAGIHPNTVRLYEQWGFLPPIPRSPSGYRRFTQVHLDQLLLARTAMSCTVIGGDVRRTALELIHTAAGGDLGGALELAYSFHAAVQAERAQAEAAATFLERWAEGGSVEARIHPLRIGDAARLLTTSIDALRNWERNGLLVVPRDPANGYRLYGAEEIGRLRVIRMLIRSGYGCMSILRMLTLLDGGQTGNLRQALDTPDEDADIHYVTDRWLSTLADAAEAAQKTVGMVEAMLQKSAPHQTG